jgi:hypothetical protein
MTVIDSGQQKRLLKEKIRGSVRKTERTIFRVDLLSTAAQAGRDFYHGSLFRPCWPRTRNGSRRVTRWVERTEVRGDE